MINSERLTLIPLTLQQLETSLSSIKQLSIDLDLPVVADLLDGEACAAVERKVKKMQAYPQGQFLWTTFWLIYINEEKIGAGLIGFQGEPDDEGIVEIEYGLTPVYQGCGYMSEAVDRMVEWAFSHPECKSITATNVKPDNFAARKVLVKTGFMETYNDELGVNYMRVPE